MGLSHTVPPFVLFQHALMSRRLRLVTSILAWLAATGYWLGLGGLLGGLVIGINATVVRFSAFYTRDMILVTSITVGCIARDALN